MTCSTKTRCADFGMAIKHLGSLDHCDGCSSMNKCLMISQLRILTELHQMIGIALVKAGVVQGVDERGRPIGRPAVLDPRTIMPHGLPGKPL